MRSAIFGLFLLIVCVRIQPASAVELRYFDHPRYDWYQFADVEPAWSPDGSTLAYLGLFGADPTRIRGAALRAVTLAGVVLPWLQVVTGYDDLGPGTWAPNGSSVAYVHDSYENSRRGIWVARSSGEGPALLSTFYRRYIMDLAWSPLGDVIAVTTTDSLWLVSATDGTHRLLRTDDGPYDSPAWSPDGKHLAFCSERSGNQDLWILDIETSSLRQLTDNPAADCDPEWSANGRWIAFSSNRSGTFDLWVVRDDGSTTVQITTKGSDRQPTWSPSGDAIAFVSDRDVQSEPHRWGSAIWIATELPDVVTSIAPSSWSNRKKAYR